MSRELPAAMVMLYILYRPLLTFEIRYTMPRVSIPLIMTLIEITMHSTCSMSKRLRNLHAGVTGVAVPEEGAEGIELGEGRSA